MGVVMSIEKVAAKLCFGLMMLAPFAVAASVGEVFYSEGQVQVNRSGLQSLATKGFQLEVGDVITTGPASQVRMRMGDDSYFALPGNSSFKIDEFSLPQKSRTRKAGSAIFSLLRGGLRTISGLIGDWSGDTYKLNTPVITMGIRGTEYSVIYCKKSCESAPDGGYIEVLSGAINASNKGGAVDLAEGEWGEVHSPPKKVNARPTVFVTDKSGVFDVSARIDVAPDAVKAKAKVKAGDAGVDLRIERGPQEPPVSPSAPSN